MQNKGTGASAPKAAKSSDGSGEASGGKVNGIVMGKADGGVRAKGSKERGEFNSGRSESTCYNHKKGG